VAGSRRPRQVGPNARSGNALSRWITTTPDCVWAEFCFGTTLVCRTIALPVSPCRIAPISLCKRDKTLHDRTVKARWEIGLALVIVASAVGGAWIYFWRTHNISLVQRGFDEAVEHGCFTCHGLGGMSGVNNPGSRWKTVPAWGGGTSMMFIREEKEIREYILDGGPARLRKDKDWQAEQSKALIHMPAFRDEVDGEELSELAAYFKAVAAYDDITDEGASRGLDEARSLGCLNCHGPEGRGCMPNPGALRLRGVR
jgi:hypothetical protein